MQARISALRRRVEQLKGRQAQLAQTVADVEKTITNITRQHHRYERALEIVKHVGLLTQQQLEYHLAEQVSLAMDAVFDDPYALKVQFVEKRGKTEANILFERRGLAFPPVGSAGGGAIDVAAFALRVAYWSMRQDLKVAPVLLLDEPFSQLKGEQANLRALAIVKQLSGQLGVQVIMVSDERVPREDIIENADQVIHVTQRATGVSAVTPIGAE